MTAICFSYVHVSYKKAAFIPDASIGAFRRNFITVFLSFCNKKILTIFFYEKTLLFFIYFAYWICNILYMHKTDLLWHLKMPAGMTWCLK